MSVSMVLVVAVLVLLELHPARSQISTFTSTRKTLFFFFLLICRMLIVTNAFEVYPPYKRMSRHSLNSQHKQAEVYILLLCLLNHRYKNYLTCCKGLNYVCVYMYICVCTYDLFQIKKPFHI
jgi:hypothetical protein